jgi:hypothetical protein
MLKKLLECQGAVVFLIVRSVDKGDGALLDLLPQESDRRWTGVQFFPVALDELLPLCRVMAEPLAQPRGGRHVLQPQVQRRFLLSHASGPESLYQDSQAVIS